MTHINFNIIYAAFTIVLSGSFIFAAIQGDNGVLKHAETEAEKSTLSEERRQLQQQLDRLKHLTARLSDNNLDLDLLDERARAVLGYIHVDDVIIR